MVKLYGSMQHSAVHLLHLPEDRVSRVIKVRDLPTSNKCREVCDFSREGIPLTHSDTGGHCTCPVLNNPLPLQPMHESAKIRKSWTWDLRETLH